MSNPQTPDAADFSELGLIPPLLKTLQTLGYENPTQIQQQTIPLLLAGKDVVGQAQTGTGKTAAFALPLLSRIDLKQRQPQILVLTPTRELAIQVAEAFQSYASQLKDFHVAPIYGGQSYDPQIRQLKRGVHVIVGTPGRLIDHMRRKTIRLDGLMTLVLDEADEMLRMGFIDDVEWIMEQTPASRQIALFSATMPDVIRKIARSRLNDPQQVTIREKTTTAATIRQRYWMVSGAHKLDVLTRLLEVEPFDGMIIFVRTKNSATELAEKLEARGHSAAPLTGDLVQKQRERTVEQLKSGRLDILVATDVAARGLDVERITHVINYDIPYDSESYTHRIGRTGRAGRKGDAILFVAPREKRMLATIERATRQKIEVLELPSNQTINDQRIDRFKQRITDTLELEGLEFFQQMISDYINEHNIPPVDVAAALARLFQGDRPLLLTKQPRQERHQERRDDRPSSSAGNTRKEPRKKRAPGNRPRKEGMERYRIEVGHDDQLKPANIVGAIANEAGIDGEYIGPIEIFDSYSLVDLPEDMPKDIFKALRKTWVVGKQLRISLHQNDRAHEATRKPRPKFDKPRKNGPGKPHKKRLDAHKPKNTD